MSAEAAGVPSVALPGGPSIAGRHFPQDSRSSSGFSSCVRNILVPMSVLAVLASATSPWQHQSSLTGELSAVSLTSHRPFNIPRFVLINVRLLSCSQGCLCSPLSSCEYSSLKTGLTQLMGRDGEGLEASAKAGTTALCCHQLPPALSSSRSPAEGFGNDALSTG